jgi:hypothetical protein
VIDQRAIAIASISTRASPTSREHSNVVRAGGSTAKYDANTPFISGSSFRSFR